MASLFPDRRVVRAELDGMIVDAVFELNTVEHERRVAASLGAMSYLRLLRWLVDLPGDRLYADPALAATGLLPDGVFQWTASGRIERLLEPPVVLDAVVVPAIGRAQTRHVRVAERFAPYAPRWVISGDPRVDASTLVAASVRGVGLVTRWPEPEVIASAAPAIGRASPGVAWLLAEQVYGAWLEAGGPRATRGTDVDAGAGLIQVS